MSSNYGLILVVLTFVSGIIWLIDAFTAGKKRKAAVAKLYEQDPEPSEEALEAVSREPIYVDYSKSFFPILLFIVVLRSFLYEPFQIPSASMKPTLTEGDFILVNKFNYGLRLPVTSQKFVEIGSPQRGDVAVFRAPNPPHEDYIKRIVGLPGDTVFFTVTKDLYVQPYCADDVAKEECPGVIKIERELVTNEKYIDQNPDTGEIRETLRYKEKLGEDFHEILINPDLKERMKQYPRNIPRVRLEVEDRTFPVAAYQYVVPKGHFFVMGDNRDNSSDGRYWYGTNFVPEENLVGQAVSIWLHLDFGIKHEWSVLRKIPTNVDFSRVGAIK